MTGMRKRFTAKQGLIKMRGDLIRKPQFLRLFVCPNHLLGLALLSAAQIWTQFALCLQRDFASLLKQLLRWTFHISKKGKQSWWRNTHQAVGQQSRDALCDLTEVTDWRHTLAEAQFLP